ncbi:MAG: hypothetical protein ACREJD_14855 [Phycisphaerales bacterium]
MSKTAIDDILRLRDTDGLDSKLDDIASAILLESKPAALDRACLELSSLFCALVRSDWRTGGEMFAVLHCGFWASLPIQRQEDIAVDALRASHPSTLEPLIMTVADLSVDHLDACPEIAAQWLRLRRESDTWADYCSYAVRVPSGSVARKWLEDNWVEPSVDELIRLLKWYGWAS